MSVNPALQAASQRFTHWLRDQALPLYTTVAMDSETGGSHEQLLADGSVDFGAKRRVRVHARQIYAFSAAQQQGWIDNGAALVQSLVHYLDTYGRNPDTQIGYAHVLNPDNSLQDSKLDLYDCAFHMFAANARFRVFRDAAGLTEANALMAYLDQYLKGPNAGWLEGNYPAPVRRQNPHMHLFETFMALFETTLDGRWLAKAGEVFALFEQVFFDHQRGVLREFFQHDWQPDANRGDLIEPGHMFEWVWLLRRYERLTQTPTAHYCQRLLANAHALGEDSASGLIYDEVHVDGEITKASKRNWPLIEMIKAYIAEAEFGNKEAEQKAADAIELLFKYFISPAHPGCWIDQRSQSNEVQSDLSPSSTLYHLILACIEAQEYCQARA